MEVEVADMVSEGETTAELFVQSKFQEGDFRLELLATHGRTVRGGHSCCSAGTIFY